MFQLLVAVIAIALVVLMVLVGMYYGGDAHTEAALRAQYTRNMNVAAQIDGALHLYYQEHAVYPNDGTDPLVDDVLLGHLRDETYLKDIPDGDWKVKPGFIYKPIEADATRAQCEALNRVAGVDLASATDLIDDFEGCPPCNGVEGSPEFNLAVKYKGWPGCQLIE